MTSKMKKISILWLNYAQLQELETTSPNSFKVVCWPTPDQVGTPMWGVYLYETESN